MTAECFSFARPARTVDVAKRGRVGAARFVGPAVARAGRPVRPRSSLTRRAVSTTSLVSACMGSSLMYCAALDTLIAAMIFPRNVPDGCGDIANLISIVLEVEGSGCGDPRPGCRSFFHYVVLIACRSRSGGDTALACTSPTITGTL